MGKDKNEGGAEDPWRACAHAFAHFLTCGRPVSVQTKDPWVSLGQGPVEYNRNNVKDIEDGRM